MYILILKALKATCACFTLEAVVKLMHLYLLDVGNNERTLYVGAISVSRCNPVSLRGIGVRTKTAR